MADCEFRSRLGVYNDGELPRQEARRLERHLERCASCAAELDEVRRLSNLFGTFAEQPVDDAVVTDFHRIVDELEDRQASILRIGKLLTGLAASGLIVASAWRLETPLPRPPPQALVVKAHAPAPQWERLAMTLRVDPLPRTEVDPRSEREQMLADAAVANWMLRNLDSQGAR